MEPLSILGAGMITGLGSTAPETCAALRAGLSSMEETRFHFDGEYLPGGMVPSVADRRGRDRLLEMVVPAIDECLGAVAEARIPRREIVLLLCLAEPERPGRFPGPDSALFDEVQRRLGGPFHADSRSLPGGRTSGARALDAASGLIASGRRLCVIAGVDSLISGPTLAAFHEGRRLLTEKNRNGFLPGEAGAAVLVGPIRGDASTELACRGLGFGEEPAPRGSGRPLRADGMVAAIRAAFADSNADYDAVDFRISDVSGEQYGFRELALALTRTLRRRKVHFDLWHPAEGLGECGAAAVPIVLGTALFAARKGYAPGPGVMAHFASDGAERAAVVLRAGARRDG